MITEISVSDMFSNRDAVLQYIKDRKFKSVIDVGGSSASWTTEVSTHYVDIREHESDSGKYHFVADVCNPNDWIAIEDYVKQNGKFDFCICSHTIEDVVNPQIVCEKISSIANEGAVLVPSKYKEFHKHEMSLSPDRSGNALGPENDDSYLRMHSGKFYRGYGHHMWYMSVNRDRQIYAVPKFGHIEVDHYYDAIGDNDKSVADLCVFWKESIPFKMVIPSLFCDNIQQQLSYCRMLLINDEIDILMKRKFLAIVETNDTFGRATGAIPYRKYFEMRVPGEADFFGSIHLYRDDDDDLESFILKFRRLPLITDGDWRSK